ncbi:MAG: DUF512 domain-containing protein [Clostridia bacterium]|nr:DUF512 domain-containing protein [Clostridia bacterium]
MAARIATVDAGSLAAQAGLRVGDTILSINGIEIHDYLDYMYASCQEEAEIILTDRKVVVDNEDYMPLGIGFDTLLIDQPRSCHNRCVFCFIDQLPKGMRETCYFKDDDYRLSFLQGNYVSMTNMQEADVERILRYNLPRINVSVHTTNPELRQTMLHNKRAGEVLGYLKRFADGGLNLNAQIVLCPGYNDGAELDRTLKDLSDLGYSMESISIVPVGLSDHRQGLASLTGFDKQSAQAVIDQVSKWQAKFLDTLGTRLVYLGDEFYLMAEAPMPAYEDYEGFPQLENGVGLCASLKYEFGEALSDAKHRLPKRKKTIATGKSALPLMQELTGMLEGAQISVVAIENRYFGENITVTGLITGQDLIAQLQGKEIGEELLISSAMLRHDEAVFLDDTTVTQVAEALGVPVTVVPNDGFELLDALLA